MKRKLVLLITILLFIGIASSIELSNPDAVYTGSENPTILLIGNIDNTNDLIMGTGSSIYFFTSGDLIQNKAFTDADTTISLSHNDIAIGDVNGDNNQDLIVATPSSTSIFYGNPLQTSADVEFVGSVIHATSCDIQKDGIDDIIVADSSNIYIINGSDSLSNTNLGEVGIIITGSSITDLGCADIHNDNQDDLIVLADNLYALYGENINNKGSLTESEVTITLTGTSPSMIKTGKIDSDSDGYDLVLGDSSNDRVYLLPESTIQDGELTSLADTYSAENSGDQAGKSISIGDFNNNGYENILIGAPKNDENGDNAGKIYLINGEDASGGSLSSITQTYLGKELDNAGKVLGTGDLDEDGYSDLIIGTAQNRVYIVRGGSSANNPPSKVDLDSPQNDFKTTDKTPKFNWTTATDPEGDTITYGLEISNKSDFSEINYNFDSLTENTYTPSSDLDDGGYWWRVKSKDATGYNTSENYELTIDTTGPNFTLTLPDSIPLEGSIQVDCNPEDELLEVVYTQINLTKPGGYTYAKNETDNHLFNNDETNETGTYTVICIAKDFLNNTNSLTDTFIINSTSGSQDGGDNSGSTNGGSQGTGITKKILSGSRGSKIEFNFKGETHAATILNVLKTAVVVLVESDPTQITLKTGESEEVDLDKDGTADVYIVLKALQPEVSAELEVTVINPEESAIGEDGGKTAEKSGSPVESEGSTTSKTNYVLWIVLSIVLLILIAAGIFYYVSKRKGKKEGYEF